MYRWMGEGKRAVLLVEDKWTKGDEQMRKLSWTFVEVEGSSFAETNDEYYRNNFNCQDIMVGLI